jgi:glycosyltransferase involved in cell wall biosynthesis
MTRLAVVVSGFPRVSETFALNELLALQKQGMLAAVFATKLGDWTSVQPQVSQLRCSVQTLPPGDAHQQARALARSVDDRASLSGVHGYFAHQPAAVAASAARLLGVPFAFSTHALDVRKVQRSELLTRAREARGVLACNGETATELQSKGVGARLVPHGVDLSRFKPPPRSGRRDSVPVRVLAVGRMVEKKGFSFLLQAVARARADLVVRIVGTGAQESALRQQVTDQGLEDRVEMPGPRTHASLADEYAWADIVAVPSVVDATGDRDGLPNVVLEAMASGCAVVASDVAAIADAVEHGRSGLLVPPADVSALAAALDALASDPVRRADLAAAARRRVDAHFALEACTGLLCESLRELYA